jgi:anthranilate synthase component 2
MKIFILDNYDSFTYMLKDYIKQFGCECMVKRNDENLNEKELREYNAIVISPGPKTPKESGKLLEIISLYHQIKPVLGICLGHQAIGEFFGATLVKSQLPRHGKVDEMNHTNHELFNQVPYTFNATRYHSLILKDIKSPLQIIATSKNDEVMAIAHKTLPVFGIQFHPESCLTKDGLHIIKNFLQIAKELA